MIFIKKTHFWLFYFTNFITLVNDVMIFSVYYESTKSYRWKLLLILFECYVYIQLVKMLIGLIILKQYGKRIEGTVFI